MRVINMNTAAVQVELRTPTGERDFIHLAPRGKADLPPGYSVYNNWLVANPQVKLVGEAQPEIGG